MEGSKVFRTRWPRMGLGWEEESGCCVCDGDGCDGSEEEDGCLGLGMRRAGLRW